MKGEMCILICMMAAVTGPGCHKSTGLNTKHFHVQGFDWPCKTKTCNTQLQHIFELITFQLLSDFQLFIMNMHNKLPVILHHT